jgi:two-component system cell cycle sensor histidine kinase/response regulator CckA
VNDEAVELLAAGIARGFDYLLTAIVGHAENLSADLSPADPRAGDVAKIREAAEQANALTQQLLAFCRMQALRPTIVDLDVVVERARRTLSRILGRHVAFEVRLAGSLRTVHADAGQLVEILRHLVRNAGDAMPDGGVVTIATANVTLDAAAALPLGLQAGEYVELSVADTGVGIEPSVQAHLFEPFFTTRDRERAKGLGLAMVRGFVRQSGGSVAVESAIGRGARFTVYLPAATETAAEDEAGKVARDSRGSETVLVTGDDRAVRMLIGDVLRRRGYQMMTAENTGHAMRQSDAHRGEIDLLITSGSEGAALAETLLEQRPNMKVIYVLAPGEDRPDQAGISVDDLLAKPFSPETLARKVGAVLAG